MDQLSVQFQRALLSAVLTLVSHRSTVSTNLSLNIASRIPRGGSCDFVVTKSDGVSAIPPVIAHSLPVSNILEAAVVDLMVGATIHFYVKCEAEAADMPRKCLSAKVIIKHPAQASVVLSIDPNIAFSYLRAARSIANLESDYDKGLAVYDLKTPGFIINEEGGNDEKQ